MEVNLKEGWSKDTLGCYGQDPDKKLPYPVHIFPNLLSNDTAARLRLDLKSSVKLRPKDNDLYKFKQSADIKVEIPSKKLTNLTHDFIDAMEGPVKRHLEKVTGLKLSDRHFDITVSRYDVGDYLLCHNDDIRNSSKSHKRALAFIYYLTNLEWTAQDGGALALYASDKAGEPVAISNRIYPRPDTLVVFDTTSTSWHAVEEVYRRDDTRLSVNGWFHVDTDAEIEQELQSQIEPCPFDFFRPSVLDMRVEEFFKSCISQEYMEEKTCYLIRRKFKRNSEINLVNFLVPDKYREISDALKSVSLNGENLTHVGPYNKRCYKKISLEKLPEICRVLYDAFRSELFFLLLSRLTGLDLQPPCLEGEDELDDEAESDSEDYDSSGDEDDEESVDRDDDDEKDPADDDDLDREDSGGRDDKIFDPKKELSQDTQENTGGDLSEATGKRKASDQGDTQDEQPETLMNRLKKKRKSSDPFARLEFRSLSPGSYSLIHDHNYELGEKSALDVVLHFNHDFGVCFSYGGYISYIDSSPEEDPHDMDCELLTIEPKSNCLSLVYRCDVGTCRFLKYINQSHKSNYHDLSCVFYERPDDLPRKDDALNVKT